METEKTGLGKRLKARRQAQKQRAAERARTRQEHKVEGNPRHVRSKNTGGSGGV
jgi:hypothetical protein